MASATLNLGSACHVAPGTSLAQPWRTHSLPVLHLGSVSLEPPLQIMRGSGAGTVGALQPRLWRTSTPLCGIARFSSGACVRRPIAVAQKLPGTSVGRARSSDVVPRAAPPQTSLPPAEDAKDVAANQDEAAGDEWPWDWTQGATPEIAFALMFASIPLVPLLPRFQWSASLYFTCLALWAIYVGSHRSLKTRQAQKISLQQSFAVPVLCSVTLFGFYCLLRFFPDLDLRSFFGAYLSLVGTLAVGSNLSDPLRKALPQLNDKWSTQIDLPKWVMTEEGQPVHVTLAPTDVLAALVGLGASLGSQQSGAPFTLGNFVAVCIVTELLQLLSLGSFATAAVMLSGLLVYDVFWVFGSSQVFGDNVMVTVATSQALDGPMKLVFPNWNPDAMNPSILGLGDVAAPGLLMALMLRFDRARWRSSGSPGIPTQALGLSPSPAPTPDENVPAGVPPLADKSYFVAAVVSYVLGLAVTIGFNAFTGAAQPALLYLVPSLLCGIFGVAAVRSELRILWEYKDEPLVTTVDPIPLGVDITDKSNL